MDNYYVELPQYIIKEYRNGILYQEKIIGGNIDVANRYFDKIINSKFDSTIHYNFILYDNYAWAKIREYDSLTDSSGTTTITD